MGTLRTGRRLAGSNDELKPGCDPEGWIFLAVALAVLLLMVFVVAPIVIAVVDVLGLLVLAGAGVIGRVVFRRPWTVEARDDDGTVLTWQVVGWRASDERAADVAELVASGVTPPLS
ncbi:MAG TPA: hypothetical protein VGO78_10095 [Acidimicrobiales bacterium]|nr:hypothetical protein [Acidimicrobiales bacterium]